ncbi:MAG: hypothetical protein AB1918_11605 [Pseudomonadota bacterium]
MSTGTRPIGQILQALADAFHGNRVEWTSVPADCRPPTAKLLFDRPEDLTAFVGALRDLSDLMRPADPVNVAGCGPIPVGPRTVTCPGDGRPCERLGILGTGACHGCWLSMMYGAVTDSEIPTLETAIADLVAEGGQLVVPGARPAAACAEGLEIFRPVYGTPVEG